MEAFKKMLTPGKAEDGEPGTPRTPTRKATCASQDAVAQKEMADLREIKQDSERLCALVEAGLKEGNLTDHTPTLERVAALSNRLLCRNRAREAAVRFGTALRVTRPGAPTSTKSPRTATAEPK